jgi:hypothetical protein
MHQVYTTVDTCVKVFLEHAGKTADIKTKSFAGNSSYILLFPF